MNKLQVGLTREFVSGFHHAVIDLFKDGDDESRKSRFIAVGEMFAKLHDMAARCEQMDDIIGGACAKIMAEEKSE